MEFILSITQEIRSTLGQLSISKQLSSDILISSENQSQLLTENCHIIETLCNCSVSISNSKSEQILYDVSVTSDAEYSALVQLDLKNTVDVSSVTEQMQNSIDQIQNYRSKLTSKLDKIGMSNQTPLEVVEELKTKIADAGLKIKTLESSLVKLQKLQ